MKTNNIRSIGQPAALLSMAFAVIYSIFQLLAIFKLIPHPKELFWLFLPSLLLAYTFLITIICLHYLVAEAHKIYTAIASAFALLYCAFVSIVYFTQLAVVIPLLSHGKIDDTHLLAFTDKSFLVAVDCIGYATMNASTFFAALAFRFDERNRSLYRSLLFNGLQTPIVLLAYFIPLFMFIGALWMVTLPMAMINVYNWFRKNRHELFKKRSYETAMA
jgi:hypothetical protein